MNIGILAIAFVIVCAVVTLTAPRPDKAPDETPNYNKIYEAILPREI